MFLQTWNSREHSKNNISNNTVRIVFLNLPFITDINYNIESEMLMGSFSQ